MKNVTVASFEGTNRVKTAPLFQWDYGQILKFENIDLPDAFEVHFSNTPSIGAARIQIGENGQVLIPDGYLATGQTIYVWIFLHEEDADGETEYMVTIPVIQRPVPAGPAPSPEEQNVITETIAALQAGVEKAEGYADSAEQSKVAAAASAVSAGEQAIASGRSATAAAGSATAAAGSASDAEETFERVEALAGEIEEAAAVAAAKAAKSYAETAQQAAASASGSATAASASAAAAGDAETAAEEYAAAAASFSGGTIAITNMVDGTRYKMGFRADTEGLAVTLTEDSTEEGS